MDQTFSLTVNGAAVEVTAHAAAPLIDVLRNALALTGTRFGCGAEQCGACMVLIDGAPSYACTTPADSAVGRRIETVEGLGPDHLVVRAFIAEQAGQCGYCLSGVLISAKALLERTPDPTDTQILAALERHLRRCGAHPRILRAVRRAAADMRA